MEVVGRGTAVHDLHVKTLKDILVVIVYAIEWYCIVLVTELEVPLDSAGGVLWAISVVSVREEHHKTALDIPLRFT